MHWKTEIYKNAYAIAGEFIDNPDVVAVAIGGSIAKGTVWKHSDVELCLIVKRTISKFQYFNFIKGMGVEVIQILEEQIMEFLKSFDKPDISILQFPIQIYQCKIIYDPTKVLAEFKNVYDNCLFHPTIKKLKEEEALNHVDKRISISKELLEGAKYKTALAHMRIGMNDLLLAYYWHYNILPRSQNRTVYLLKQNSKIIGHYELYNAFVDVFCLSKSTSVLKNRLLMAKRDIANISEVFGSNTKMFLENAVDGNLEWGYPKSIIYVYKFFTHLLQCYEINNVAVYDTDEFKMTCGYLHDFFDFNDVEYKTVCEMLKKMQRVRNLINDSE